jgi:ABC-type antimicrobial peptide transport system permease subunit
MDSDASARSALARALDQRSGQLDLDHYADRRTIELAISGNPVQSGVRGLLTSGALAALLLAVVGVLIQSALAARLRQTQFAILRTLGMASRQVTTMLLGELLVLYALGLAGGIALGLILISTTLPFLQFGEITAEPSMLGVPPYMVAVDPLALVLALLLAARYARRVELGITLRRSED